MMDSPLVFIMVLACLLGNIFVHIEERMPNSVNQAVQVILFILTLLVIPFVFVKHDTYFLYVLIVAIPLTGYKLEWCLQGVFDKGVIGGIYRLGKRSYSFYLLHVPVLVSFSCLVYRLLYSYYPNEKLVIIVVNGMLTFFAIILSARIFEEIVIKGIVKRLGEMLFGGR